MSGRPLPTTSEGILDMGRMYRNRAFARGDCTTCTIRPAQRGMKTCGFCCGKRQSIRWIVLVRNVVIGGALAEAARRGPR